MKLYAGERTIDGLVVTVDGKPLAEHREVRCFDAGGFEWGYEGENPRQLALAILVDHLRDNERAIRWSEPFMRRVIANLDNEWQLSSADLDDAVRLYELG
jgi:hypothetical protein